MAISMTAISNKVSADAVASNYNLIDITDRLVIKATQTIQPDTVSRAYPLAYTVIALPGYYDKWSYSYTTSASSTGTYSGTVSAVLPTGSITYVILSGSGNWYKLRYSVQPLNIFLLVDTQLLDGDGTFGVIGSSSLTISLPGTLVHTRNAIDTYTYYINNYYFDPSTVSNPFATDYRLCIVGNFSQFVSVGFSGDFVPYSYNITQTISLQGGYQFAFDGALTDTLTIAGTSSQVANSYIPADSIVLEGRLTGDHNDEILIPDNNEITIVSPDSNISAITTISLDTATITAEAVPKDAIRECTSSLQILFEYQPTSTVYIDLGYQVFGDERSQSESTLKVQYLYRYRDYPQTQSAYLSAFYSAFQQFANTFDTTLVATLQNSWSQIQRPWYEQWFQKFLDVFSRDVDEDTKTEYATNADKLDNLNGQLSEGDDISNSISDIEFSAPALDSNSLLLVMLTETWQWSIFADFVATLVAVAVVAYLIFQKKGD